jgi:hypothetical protein
MVISQRNFMRTFVLPFMEDFRSYQVFLAIVTISQRFLNEADRFKKFWTSIPCVFAIWGPCHSVLDAGANLPGFPLEFIPHLMRGGNDEDMLYRC